MAVIPHGQDDQDFADETAQTRQAETREENAHRQTGINRHLGEQAAEFLQNFSKLMRQVLESSDMDFITLQEEIHFMKRYLELQHLNHENKFDYTLEVDEDLNPKEFFVPPMLTQPFIENAIIHGALKTEKGLVYIKISKNNEQVIIQIIDNKQTVSSKPQEHKKLNRSMSTDIVKQRIENLRQTHDFQITYTIENPMSDPHKTGTTVTFSIPLRPINTVSTK